MTFLIALLADSTPCDWPLNLEDILQLSKSSQPALVHICQHVLVLGDPELPDLPPISQEGEDWLARE
jgi:hypothetical protein